MTFRRHLYRLYLRRREQLIGWLGRGRVVAWLDHREGRVSSLATRLGRHRWLLRPICARRGRHRGEWVKGQSTCATCAFTVLCAAPPGQLLVDEKDRAVYQVQQNGKTYRRVDKFQGTKKDRRRNREAVAAAAATRSRIIGTGAEVGRATTEDRSSGLQ